MTLTLPNSINVYFTADRADSEAIARCFTDNAVVTDEGRTYNGRFAIEKWKADSSKKYAHTSEPLAFEEKEGKTIVTGRVTGKFPGSPIDLRFIFDLKGDKIASLEIIV